MFEKLKSIFVESRKGIIVVTYGLLLYFVLNHLSVIGHFCGTFYRLLRPMFLGLGIAYILNLPMARIESFIKKNVPKSSWFYHKSRGFSIMLTLVFAVILLTLLFAFIVPQLIDSLILLFNNLGTYATNIIQFFINILHDLHIDTAEVENFMASVEKMPWDQVINKALTWLGNVSLSISSAAGTIVNHTMGIIGELGIWFTGFMVSLYLLSGKETFVYQARKLTIALVGQDASQYAFKWGHIVNETFSHFIGGQLVEACILFLLYYISLKILRMPYALLISMLIGVTSIIPVFGAMLGSAIGFILIFAINPLQAVFFYVFYQLMQQFENNVIYPRVVGNSVGLAGVWVLVSILAFGSQLGVLGMFVAVPTSAVIYQAISAFANACIKKRHLELDDQGFVKEKKVENK